MRHTESAISRYKLVHTGANIQLGGLNDGLISPADHAAKFGIVAHWPTNNAARTEIMATAAPDSPGPGRFSPMITCIPDIVLKLSFRGAVAATTAEVAIVYVAT